MGNIQPIGFPGIPAGWESEAVSFSSPDGLHLFCAVHRNSKKPGPRALVIIHGHGEHGGRYAHFPHYLSNTVDAIYCPDLRGHGRSEGLRGDVERFDQLAEDAAAVIREIEAQIRKRHGKAEIHLLGHSLGGHIALRTLFLNTDLPIASASVSAPFLGVKQKVPVAKKIAAHALSRIWGTLQLGTGIDVNGISRDPEVIAAYKRDRLVHDKMTPRFYTAMTEAWADTLEREGGISVPLQFLVPLADPIVDPEKSMALFERLVIHDKRIRTYEDFRHEPFNEIGKEGPFEDLKGWIASHSVISAADSAASQEKS